MNLDSFFAPLRAPDGPAAGAAPAAPAPGAPAPGDQPPAAAPPAAPSAVPPAPAAPPAVELYRPQGLPETMFGKDDRETMDKMAGALAGYRTRDAERQVPDKPDAYAAFEVDKAPEAIRPYLPGLAKDPAFTAAAKIAMEQGIPVKAMHAMTTAVYQAAAEAGILEPPVDVAAERTKLLPEAAKNLPQAGQDAAIEARLKENEDFLKLLMTPGADGKSQLPKEVGENALLMLMDTAAGNQFLEFFRQQMTGAGKAQPLAGTGAAPTGQSERAALEAELAKPEMNPQHPKFNRAAYDALDERFKRLYGN